MLRVRLVFWYIIWCLRLGVGPWHYFQLNSPWFNSQKHMFSKLEMDSQIPVKWRLQQAPLLTDSPPASWPVFLKPEWGQNSKGIMLAKDPASFDAARQRLSSAKIPYLYQQAATGKREFEVFYIRDAVDTKKAAVLSITETLNSSPDDWPINSISNAHTSHKTLTHLGTKQSQQLWKTLNQLPDFRIARIGLRADRLETMLAGDFQIIEINLYVPMPLHLLDETIPLAERHEFITNNMHKLALLTQSVAQQQPRKHIFWPMLLHNHRVRPWF